jgi:hypothetical protein
MTDLDIVMRVSRPWASLHACTEAAKAWIAANLPIRESAAIVTFPAAFVEDYVAAIERTSAPSARVRAAA